MKSADVRGVLEWSMIVALVLGSGALVRAQPTPPEGPVLPVIPPDYSDEMMIKAIQRNPPITLPTPIPGVPGQEADVPSPYWIGLSGGPVSPELRAQLDLPEGQGVIVREVVPDSPAAEAGLEQFDVLVRANDDNLGDMRQLSKLVQSAGESHSPFSLELLRKGERQTATIAPAERPQRAQLERPPGGDLSNGARGLLVPFWGDDKPFALRSFGPSVIVGQPHVVAKLPSGVSVTIEKQDDGPAKITIKRGDETWEVEGDDPKAFKRLPEDIRPFVAQMLYGDPAPQFVVPQAPQAVPLIVPRFDDQEFRQRLERMQERLEKTQERMQNAQQRLQQAQERLEAQLKELQKTPAKQPNAPPEPPQPPADAVE